MYHILSLEVRLEYLQKAIYVHLRGLSADEIVLRILDGLIYQKRPEWHEILTKEWKIIKFKNSRSEGTKKIE